jgi:hypothetical protein
MPLGSARGDALKGDAILPAFNPSGSEVNELFPAMCVKVVGS